MRYRKQQISKTIKSDLQIEFVPQDITSHSGLELFRRYFRLIGLNSRIRRAFRRFNFKGDYSVMHCILVFVALWLTGGRRLRHVKFIADDPLVRRLCGLNSLPSDRTLSRWLGQFTNDTLQALVGLNSELVAESLQALDLSRITLDFDGTVLSCGNRVSWAFRGYNPQNRHAKSYFPLLCHVAQTGHFLQVKNRPGNIHDSKCGALGLIRSCISQIRHMYPNIVIEVRMDSAFFQQDILKYLVREKIEFAIKVPMWKWLGLKELIQTRSRWFRSNPRLSWFSRHHQVPQWDLDLPLTFFRQKVSDKIPKSGHQLDFFSPNDGIYEHSIIVSNKNLSPENLLQFYNGRCAMEHQLGELKGEFAFDVIPTKQYQANSAHQNISLMAYNLVRSFQIDSQMTKNRKKTVSRTNILEFSSLKTIRFEMINAAGRILNTSGRKVLRINYNIARKNLFKSVSESLAAA
jgi:hypothetical protein